jgi:hypothetical protein
LVAALVVVLVLMVCVVVLAGAWDLQVPGCQEDSVLVGVGSFDGSSGQWSRYECGPAVDDCQGVDVNGDGVVNVLDVQLMVNEYLEGESDGD